MIGLALLPVGAFMFFSLTSHFFPRLSALLIPNLISILVVISAWMLLWLIRMLARTRSPRFVALVGAN
jgi:hypothetical protein